MGRREERINEKEEAEKTKFSFSECSEFNWQENLARSYFNFSIPEHLVFRFSVLLLAGLRSGMQGCSMGDLVH